MYTNIYTEIKVVKICLWPFKTFTDYTWIVKFPEDRHLIKNESRRKKYYYNYYQTLTTYEGARKICQDRGKGWNLASFQAKPILQYYYNIDRNGWSFTINNKTHNKSIENIE